MQCGIRFTFQTINERANMADQSDQSSSKSGILARRGLLATAGVVIIGIVIGLSMGGFSASMIHATSTTEFCVSCHVYENFYPEFQGSVHNANASGVQAGCSDCHIAHDSWYNMMYVKAKSGLSDMWAYTVGGVNTPEEFEAKRREMAERVWARHESNDSQYCRSCHQEEAWDLEAQEPAARAAHQIAMNQDQTCINCHKGIAHEIPPEEPSESSAEAKGSGDVIESAGETETLEAAEGEAEEEAEAAATPSDSSSSAEAEGSAEVLESAGETETLEAAAGEAAAESAEPTASDSTETATASSEDQATETVAAADTKNEAEPQAETGDTQTAPGASETQSQAQGTQVASADIDAESIFSGCRGCHGTFAPHPTELAALEQSAFEKNIANHQNVGGLVSGLNQAEIDAVYAYLQTL